MSERMVKRSGRIGLVLLGLALQGCAAGPARGQPVAEEREGSNEPLDTPRAASAFEYFGGLKLDPDVPTPRAIIGHEIGARFTRHDQMLGYVSILASVSDRVEMEMYGTTHEGRQLAFLTISSAANLSRLDEILDANRELADPATSEARARKIIDANPAMVWLSYNVHGNEASATEAAIQVAYTMAAATNDALLDILDKVVLVIDPCLNPDGRERYVHWYQTTRGREADAKPDAAEHDQRWPGGRTNHYLFDLNRDWLWLTQPESRARLEAYKRFLPQLHIDYHEQERRSPYFFGAGDDPYNQNIPEETRLWVERYGAANAAVFDERGILYATKERFDYLYPGYGKVLPVYNGAVGMLCEKAGGAGLAIENYEGHHTLTLQERALHHFLTSMSYLESTAAWRGEQLERFRRFFVESMEAPEDGTWGYVLSSANDRVLLGGVVELCRAHGIEVFLTDADQALDGLVDYATGEPMNGVEIPDGSLVIKASQPMGRLARALFERDPIVTDIETYDITAWSLPVAYGLDAYVANAPVATQDEPVEIWEYTAGRAVGAGGVAIVVDAGQHWFPVSVGLAIRHGLFARRAGSEIEIEGQWYERGSMIIHVLRNEGRDLESFLDDCAAANVRAVRVNTGLTTSGPVLGANENRAMTMPQVALAYGPGTSSYSAGQHWHMLDFASPLPHTRVYVDALGRVDLSDYTVLVLPSGVSLGEGASERVSAWVRGGGTVVASGSSAYWASTALLDLEDDPAEEEAADEPALNELSFEARRDRGIEDRVPGAMVKVAIDTTHPLTPGVRSWLGVIKTDARSLPVADDGYVIGRYDGRVGGRISDRNVEKLTGKPFMTQHRLGRGSVICLADDVTIRGFQHAGMRLLLNAIVLGPTE
jgi:hypothetical protein